MLQAIANLGGWLLMMGQHDRSESLFYYFRIEDQVPEKHLLRFIDRYVSFDFVREKLRASYSETGRPSIDPEVLTIVMPWTEKSRRLEPSASTPPAPCVSPKSQPEWNTSFLVD